jgi:hypothetical protein
MTEQADQPFCFLPKSMDVATTSNRRLSFATSKLTMNHCENSIRIIPVRTVSPTARIASATATIMQPGFIVMPFTDNSKMADTARVGRPA